MTRLVISIRSVAEVEPALEGGAEMLDIKEPAHGPLGAADLETTRAIVEQVRGRVPVSVARGEWRERDPAIDEQVMRLGVRYIKWGWSGCEPTRFAEMRSLPDTGPTRPVLVSYADADHARAPRLAETLSAAGELGISTVLLDTFAKDGRTLLDHQSVAQLHAAMRCSLGARLQWALAGSLRAEQFALLAPLRPAWLAVRSAATRTGERTDAVDPVRVRRLRELLAEVDPADLQRPTPV